MNWERAPTVPFNSLEIEFQVEMNRRISKRVCVTTGGGLPTYIMLSMSSMQIKNIILKYV